MVPGLELWNSEFCLRREKFNRPPRLDRPIVEDELRPEGGSGWVRIGSSSARPLREPLLELRPFLVRRAGCVAKGDDLQDGDASMECRGEVGGLAGLKLSVEPSSWIREGVVGVGSAKLWSTLSSSRRTAVSGGVLIGDW